MTLDHETLLWIANSLGLFYLIAFSIAVVIYAYRPANERRFDRAAKSILHDEDGPCR